MTWLPIVERELRVASRKAGTYWLRFWAALGVILLFSIILAANFHGAPQDISEEIFGITTALVGLACLFSGVFQTADCLSEEKREGTMGLLFLTDLRGYDVVLGKLAAGSLRVFYGFLSVLPVMALPLMMGGVSGFQFWRAVLLLLTALFFSLGLGMGVSALSRDSRQVVGITIFIILLINGILPVINGVWNLFSSRTSIIEPLLWPSLGYAFARSFDYFYDSSSGPAQFWGPLLVALILGFVFLIMACFCLPRTWQERGETDARRGHGFWRRLRYGGWQHRSRAQRRLLPANFFEWLARRDRSAQVRFWMLGLPVMALWLTVFIAAGMFGRISTPDALEMLVYLSFGMSVIFKCMVAIEASRRFNDDRRSGALELLLVTCLAEKEIVAGQRVSLGKQFGLGLLVLFAMFAALVWLCLRPGFPASGNYFFLILLSGNAVALPADFFGIGWVGMWEGLRAKSHVRAVLATLAKILFLPWLLFVLMAACGVFDFGGWRFVIYWFVVGLLIDIFWAWRARKRLRLQFREIAAGVAGRRNRAWIPAAPKQGEA